MLCGFNFAPVFLLALSAVLPEDEVRFNNPKEDGVNGALANK